MGSLVCGIAARSQAAIPHLNHVQWRPSFDAGAGMLQVIEALYASVHPTAGVHYHAFFSSELGGIVTDPALMFVHVDDHMLHRCA